MKQIDFVAAYLDLLTPSIPPALQQWKSKMRNRNEGELEERKLWWAR